MSVSRFNNSWRKYKNLRHENVTNSYKRNDFMMFFKIVLPYYNSKVLLTKTFKWLIPDAKILNSLKSVKSHCR